MRILATSAEIDRTLCDLMGRYPRYRWAVAWASHGFKTCELLLRNRHRITRLVIGTHFYQTHPEFIASLIDDPHTRFVLSPSGVFHPKVYLFEDGPRWECVLGSANFTRGGLGGNEEIASLLSDRDVGAADAHTAIAASIERFWRDGDRLTPSDLEGYRELWRRNGALRDRLAGTFGGGEKPGEDPGDKGRSPLDVAILRIPWNAYFQQVAQERKGNALAGRLAVLRFARKQFGEHSHFSAMDEETRKRIAGTIYEDRKDPDWLWFGSMRGAGKFKNLIIQNSPHASAALDAIPATGDVERRHYDAFVQEFKTAFAQYVGGGAGIATATRLLAMKRPDYFVCLDSKNRQGLCKAFSIPATVSFDRYWKSIVERITAAAWWGGKRPPRGVEQEVWDGRAALLDALYYAGK